MRPKTEAPESIADAACCLKQHGYVTDIKEVRESYAMPAPASKPMTNGFHDDGASSGLRAAQVHGQLMNDEAVRRPTRLDALPALGPVGGKKNKKKRGGLDPF